jgi:predicted glycogen debranching enzyme
VVISLGPETCRRLDEALAREWLVTNGLGGYASATVPGTPTRRYHGLLVVAKRPPFDRRVIVSQVDELVTYNGRAYQTSTTEYQGDSLSPAGYIHVAEFLLDRGLPVTRFEVGDMTMEKRVWMEHGRNTTFVQYTWSAQASAPAELVLRPLVSGRPFHDLCVGDSRRALKVTVTSDDMTVWPVAAPPVRLILSGGRVDAGGVWHWRIQYRRERERGLDFLEDLYMPGTLAVTLAPGASATLVLTTETGKIPDADRAWQAEWERRGDLERRGGSGSADALGRALTVAADAFVVTSASEPGSTAGGESAILGGYHWFGRAGRDALIALPGLLVGSGRLAEARAVLAGLLADRQDGLVPARYSETDGQPDHASVDASLWFFVALRAYLEHSGDRAFLVSCWPALVEIMTAHVIGTRFGIAVDTRDGLLRAGEVGRQLTWMDAKAGEWVVTPRRGKPVEVNALWYNAVRQMEEWTRGLEPDRVADFRRWAQQAESSFTQRYWNIAGGYLYDVIDTDIGHDGSCRPNQLLAISLPFPVLEHSRWRAVVDVVRDHLLTRAGLRTLSPGDPHYIGWYAGDAIHRDGAYHQGSIRTWLIGPFHDASQRVYPGNTFLAEHLQALERHLELAGLGTVSELFDGALPHAPQGSIADAAGVGEVLRVWRALRAQD